MVKEPDVKIHTQKKSSQVSLKSLMRICLFSQFINISDIFFYVKISTCWLHLLSCIRVMALPLRITLAVYTVGLWVCCNTDFPPVKDSSVFIFYPTAQETLGLMDIQVAYQPERVVSWWHQDFVSMEVLTESKFHSQAEDMIQWDLGVRGYWACWAWDRTKSLKTWQVSLCLYSLFTLSKQQDERSRERDKCHCRLIHLFCKGLFFSG